MSEIMKLFFQFIILLFCLESSLSQKCGFSDNSTRIYGGKDADSLKWPWMAHLNMTFEYSERPDISYSHTCGGSLINDKWVLTAAHCFAGPRIAFLLKSVVVILGEHDVTKSEGTEVPTESSKNIIHESYDHKTRENDIALIKLKDELDFNGEHKDLQPICLPQKGIPIDKNRCYATGWGLSSSRSQTWQDALKFGVKPHRGPDILQEVKLPILDDEKCKTFRKFKKDKQLCAGGEEGRDTCVGDSGGPLQCQLANNVWVEEGMTSYGPKDCGIGKPAVYTRVSAYLSWIKSKTGIK